MDFIIGLAHWCEIHGPSSILCTQVIPPSCNECFPPRGSLTRSPSAPHLGGGPTPPQSSHGRPNTTANTPITSPPPPRSATATLHLTSPSTRLPSPTETPPASPRSPTMGPIIPGGAVPESCRNCSMTLPKRFDEDTTTSKPSVRGVSPPGRPLRTTETVVVGGNASREGENPGNGTQPPSSPKFQPQFSPATQSLTTHTHTVTYLSSRSPAQASRYSHVRQACIRSLSCELAPAQTKPILFGDPQTGYTIAVVFKLSDNKSRGGRRTYALLCMSMNQKALMQSWSVISSVFQSLVHEIQHAAADRASKEAQTATSPPPPNSSMTYMSSRGPESFLRRRAPADGSSARSLADLVGNDKFFVNMHSAFVRLLAGLTKIYGYGSATTHDLNADMMPLSLGASAAAIADGRSRAGSVSSASAVEDRDRRRLETIHQYRRAPSPPSMSESQRAADQTIPSITTQAPPPVTRASTPANDSGHRRPEQQQVPRSLEMQQQQVVSRNLEVRQRQVAVT